MVPVANALAPAADKCRRLQLCRHHSDVTVAHLPACLSLTLAVDSSCQRFGCHQRVDDYRGIYRWQSAARLYEPLHKK